jgi:hypothetical protein
MTIKLPPLPHGGTLIISEDVGSRAYGKHEMEAYAREAVRLNRAPLSDEQERFLSFLYGSGEWDGVWFEERHPTKKGAFWWRSEMRRLFPAHGIKGD